MVLGFLARPLLLLLGRGSLQKLLLVAMARLCMMPCWGCSSSSSSSWGCCPCLCFVLFAKHAAEAPARATLRLLCQHACAADAAASSAAVSRRWRDQRCCCWAPCRRELFVLLLLLLLLLCCLAVLVWLEPAPPALVLFLRLQV
jgi:hypothetical protein